MGLRSRSLCVRVQLRYKGQSTQIPSQAREFKLHIKPITTLSPKKVLPFFMYY